MPVQEEHRRAVSSAAYTDCCLAGVDELELETFEHARA
jgi:hypothetical protein